MCRDTQIWIYPSSLVTALTALYCCVLINSTGILIMMKYNLHKGENSDDDFQNQPK